MSRQQVSALVKAHCFGAVEALRDGGEQADTTAVRRLVDLAESTVHAALMALVVDGRLTMRMGTKPVHYRKTAFTEARDRSVPVKVFEVAP